MRAHDLLQLSATATLHDATVPPAWVDAALARAAWVVVRRAPIIAGRVPVGVRGASREQRHAAYLSTTDVARVITPEMLAQDASWRRHSRRDLPAFAALDAVAAAATRLELGWGPAGSVGFELASGAAVVHERSDLDIVVRPAPRHTDHDLQQFADALGHFGVPIDVTVEGHQGSAALHEWLQSPQRTLIKTTQGPILGALRW